MIFISGDVHLSEVSVTNEEPYLLHDLISSGMTHANKGWSSQWVNSYRVGQAYAELNFGLILHREHQCDV